MVAMERLRRGSLVLTLALFGCATQQPPPGAPPVPPPPPPPPAAEVPPTTPPPPATVPAAEPQRLAWVNPARCLQPCIFDPPDLVTVDAAAHADPAGAHQVAREALRPLQDLLAAAASAGHPLSINSAFRSYIAQAHLFSTIKQPGRAALPGQSEHQLGLAIDLKLPGPEAADWLAAHAAEFGFVRSYPPGKHKVTGYRPEPWHVRFVGRPLAEEARAAGSLEELFRSRPDLGVSGTCGDCPARARRKPCGAITAAGACKGPLLTWCYEGALATVDCSAFSQKCTAVGGEHDCR